MFLTMFDNSRRSKLLHNIWNSLLGTNLIIFYQHFFWKLWFSILFWYTFKSCYKIMVLTSACLCIGWNTRWVAWSQGIMDSSCDVVFASVSSAVIRKYYPPHIWTSTFGRKQQSLCVIKRTMEKYALFGWLLRLVK